MVLLFLNKTIRGLNCLFFYVVVAIFKDMGGGVSCEIGLIKQK